MWQISTVHPFGPWIGRCFQMKFTQWVCINVSKQIACWQLLSTIHDLLNRKLPNNITCQWVEIVCICKWSKLSCGKLVSHSMYLYIMKVFFWLKNQTFWRKSPWEDLRVYLFFLLTDDSKTKFNLKNLYSTVYPIAQPGINSTHCTIAR